MHKQIHGVTIKEKEVKIKVGTSSSSEKTLTKITITKPSKTTYVVGEKLSTTGMKVTATYSDGSTVDKTSICNYYFDSSKVEKLEGIELTKGTHTIKATLDGKEDSFTITVNEKTSGGGNEGDGSTSPGDISEAGLEVITIPAIIISIIVAIISYKKYKLF